MLLKINKHCKKKIDSLLNNFMKNNFILYISVTLFLIIYHLYNQIRTSTMNFYARDIHYSNMPCHFISKAIKKATWNLKNVFCKLTRKEFFKMSFSEWQQNLCVQNQLSIYFLNKHQNYFLSVLFENIPWSTKLCR